MGGRGDFSLPLQSLIRLPVEHITSLFNDYSAMAVLSFSVTFLERISGLGEDCDLNAQLGDVSTLLLLLHVWACWEKLQLLSWPTSWVSLRMESTLGWMAKMLKKLGGTLLGSR